MKHKFRFFVVFALMCAFMFSCQDDEFHTESSHTHEIGLVSTEQFLQTLTNSELKSALSAIINRSSTARTIGGFEEPQAAKYFEVVEQLEYTNYMLYLQEYTEENPFHLFLVVTIEKTKGEEKAAYLKYTPSDDIKLFDIKTFSGRMDVLNIYGEIEAGADFESGKVANAVTTTQRCSTRISIMEVPCSHGGEHGVGQPCENGKVNDAYYSIVINTTCFNDYDFHLPPSSFLGGGGKSGVPYYQAYLNSLSPAQKDFIDKAENSAIKSKLISYINSYGSRNEVSTAILEYGMANGAAQIIPLYSFVMGSNNSQLRDKVNAVLLSMGNTIEAGRFAVKIYRLALINKQAAVNLIDYIQNNGFSQGKVDIASNAANSILNGVIPTNIINAVSDAWGANIISDTFAACGYPNSNLNDIFMNIFAGSNTHNVTYNLSSALSGNGLTSTNGIPVNVNGQSVYNFNISLRTSYVQTATDLSIARTVIHENLHAILLYFNYTNVISVNSGDATYEQLLTHYIDKLISMGYQPSTPITPNNTNHHAIMADIVGEISTALKAYGVSKGYNLPNSFYDSMAWGGLMNTSEFQTKYPQYLSNGNINPDWVTINNTIYSEQNNVTSTDANGNPITPKGHPHP